MISAWLRKGTIRTAPGCSMISRVAVRPLGRRLFCVIKEINFPLNANRLGELGEGSFKDLVKNPFNDFSFRWFFLTRCRLSILGRLRGSLPLRLIVAKNLI